ncbi:beta-1,4-N-acetylgalactosaminyltransferase bre-4-like isoform X1 [Mercenaria mercenaria]|uniref:beta-1,4-N-acetylgalactosaminyltransferase bre-4-like isoform X1 n=1 Tax=Mercenaria mercenaria TaxID=6596 RepID=UPI00234F923F|nr:beta-1,4-N-acetylgalactosaminyltransferase bre-4-like isoform X1 [Mercenaria mercenaria]
MVCSIGGRSRLRTFLFVVLSSVVALSILQYVINKNARTVLKTLDLTQNRSMSQWRSTTTTRNLDKCSEMPKNAAKAINISTELENLNITEDGNSNLKPGGRYWPITCVARHRVAVIVPYRDRETHLKIFLNHMHPFLQRQQLDYGIFVVESIPDVKFNRALLLNIGFVEASKLYEYDCFVFHDVDLLPENDEISYNCDQSPTHLSSAIDVKKYKLPYHSYFGGVCAFSKEHFKKINGFSNIYFGWGGEDDDIHERIKYSHLKLTRLSSKLGRYKMLKHEHANQNPDKILLFKTMKTRHSSDGLNSLKYDVIKQDYRRLYTWILVSINETEIIESEPIHKQAFNSEIVNTKSNYTLKRKNKKSYL